MELTKVGAGAFAALGLGAVLAFAVPVGLALLWVFRKKERLSTVLIGAAVFVVFALVLEKPLQALLLVPDHAVRRFLNANPVWFALVGGLFAGVFEETGRLAAFKTVLKHRRNRETAVSYGIGHGGAEVMIILGLTYVTYLSYAVMINTGTFGTVVDQVAAQAPDQVETLYTLAGQIASLTFAGVGAGLLERVFAVLFHLGASILVFYACRDRGRFWLYPLAIVLHTALDFVAGLAATQVIALPAWAIEAIIGVFGVLTFCCAYLLLYRKDAGAPERA